MITLVLLLTITVSAIDQGWIFSHGIELPPRLAVLQPASEGKLLLSSDQSLNLTSFTDPNSIQKVIATCFDQQIEFTYSDKGNEVIFIDQNLINFVPLSTSSPLESVSSLQHNNQHENASEYSNFITPAQITKVTTPVAVTQDYQALAFAGFSSQDQLIEVWGTNPKKFLASQKVSNDLRVDRLYLMQDQLRIYLLSQESLFQLQTETLTKIRQDVHFCSVCEGSELICKLCSGDIAIIGSNFSHIIDKSASIDSQKYASMVVSLDGQLLVEFGNDENFIVSNLVNKTLQTREQLASTQTHISKVAISSDGQAILTYNCVDNSAVLWQFGTCESDKEIVEGFCKCKGSLLDFGGSCGCSDGQYVDGSNSCKKCNFFCTNCEGSENSCTEVNVGGVLMIVCASLAGVLVGLLLWRWIYRKKTKKVELTAQLLESVSSEK